METTTQNLSNEKISEALELLSEAAKEKKGEIRSMISDKYSGLRDVIGGASSSLADAWTTTKQRVGDRAKEAKDVGMEKAQEYYHNMDEKVHQSPWPYLGGVALGALLLGFIMGRSGNK